MSITTKEYYCPLCGKTSNHETNHFGEIYSECTNCGEGVLYCSEKPIDYTHEATLHYYDLNIETNEGMQAYLSLGAKLKEKKYKKFHVVKNNKHSFYIKGYNGKNILIAAPHLFKDQFITNIGRVHLWFEYKNNNENIKRGYYLII